MRTGPVPVLFHGKGEAMYTLDELAKVVDGKVVGDPELKISGIASLEDAGPGDISFVAEEKHLPSAQSSKAGALLVGQDVKGVDKPLIRTANPRMAFAILLSEFAPLLHVELGIHPSAVVGEGAHVGEGTSVGANVVIAPDAQIGSDVVIYPGVYVGEGTTIGSGSIIYPNVVLREFVTVGKNVIIQPGAVIGGDGFGFVTVSGKQQKVPQIGTVVIEDDVEIGANVTIDRATCGKTVIGRGTKLDNLVQVGHNVVIGEDCLIVALTGVAGSSTIGNRVTLAGQSGVAGHLKVGDNTVVAARSLVISDLPGGQFVSGYPARPHKEAMRAIASQRKIPELIKRVKQLETELEELKDHLARN